MIDLFLKELDQKWQSVDQEPIDLYIIGSTAIFLQSDYARGTKDSDILEMKPLSIEVSKQILKLTGKGSKLAKKHHFYIEIVKQALPFLPPKPIFHRIDNLNQKLQNFVIHSLDLTDIALSKLKPFRPQDIEDISFLVKSKCIEHDQLIKRFQLTLDHWILDSRSENLKTYIENLNTIERDLFLTKESTFELPRWLVE